MVGFPGSSDSKDSPAMQDPWVGKIPWRRRWQPTPVILAGEFHGQRSLAGYSPWGRKESNMTEWLSLTPLIITSFKPLFTQCERGAKQSQENSKRRLWPQSHPSNRNCHISIWQNIKCSLKRILAATWMQLEMIILNEISQKETYPIVLLICGI